MLKVVHVITHFDQGGAERVALNIAKSKNYNIDYTIVEVTKTNGEFRNGFINECKENNISVVESPIANKKMAIVFFPLWFVFTLLKIKPNVLHSHTEIPDLSIYLFSLIFPFLCRNVKIVRTIHNNQLWNSWKYIGKRVERFFNQRKSNIAISVSTQQSYKEEYGIECPIIYNGLAPVNQIPFDGIINDKINILYAARLEYQKCPEVLGEVILRMQNNPNIHFHIVGNGSMKDMLLSMIKDCKNYTYYDKIFGLSSYLSSFDYLFMPSKFEGLALMPIEASFAKVPSIINNCLGLADTLPKDWPLMVSDNSIDGYIEIFNSLDQNIELGQVALDFVSKNFSLSNMQREYEKIYMS